MPKWAQNIKGDRLYIIGIISVALLISLNQVITQMLISERESDALVINVAGKQRMLSQRIALLSYRATENKESIELLKNLNLEFYTTHLELMNGNEDRNIPEVNNKKIRASLSNLTPLVEQIYKLVNEAESIEELADNQELLLSLTTDFLPKMDYAVSSFQQAAEKENENLANIELWIALLTVIILLVEVLLVFNPIIKAIIDKSRKLEESIESKNRILATIVHDLRNPLNGIKGLNNILKDDLTEQLTDDQMEMFSLIDESTEKANHLIEELLEISELEGEDFELERKEVRLSEYLEKSIKPFQNKAKEKGVELSISTMGNGLAVNIDPKRFERVISNLLSNALKFTSDNGRVSVELKEKEKESVIEISDTGVGIPEKVQPYIFDKFSKARRLGLEGEQSTGLGMSIVQQIVHLHQGEIWVESEENKGTTFYISLPKAS